jgi:transposase
LLGQHKTEAVIADKGYDSDKIVAHVQETMKAKAVIPPRSNRKQQRNYDKALYKLRNRIERCFNKLKHFRRFATRYEKSKTCFLALVAFACSSTITCPSSHKTFERLTYVYKYVT